MKKQIFFLICGVFAYCYSMQAQTLSSENKISDTEKIAGLSTCWAEAKYNFVYFDRLTFNWDSLYQATIPIVLASKTDFEYHRELQRFIATLKDGHTKTSWNRKDLWDNWATIPILTRLIDGKMIVTEVLNEDLGKLQGIKRGLEVVKINGIDVHEYVSTHIKPFVFSSTEQWTNLLAYGREATRGSIIGTPSGGSTGNPVGFGLPGGGWVMYCSKKDTYPDGTEFVGVGILPDIEIKETVSSFLSKAETGTDNSKATHKAIEVLKNSMK